jgi:hypothetical protein
MAAITDILLGRACRPEKTDTRFPLRQRFSAREPLVIVTINGASGVSLMLARAAKGGFVVDSPATVLSAGDTTRKIVAVRDFAKRADARFVMLASTNAVVGLESGVGASDPNWEIVPAPAGASGAVTKKRTVCVGVPDFPQHISFQVLQSDIEAHEKIIEDADLTLVGAGNLFAAALSHLARTRPECWGTHDVVVVSEKGALLLLTGENDGCLFCTARTYNPDFNLLDWLSGYKDDAIIRSRTTPRPVFLVSSNFDADAESIKTAFGAAEITGFGDVFFCDALTAQTDEHDLQLAPVRGRQVLSGVAVLFAWICLFIFFGGTAIGALCVWDSLKKEEVVKEAGTRAETLVGEKIAKSGEVVEIRKGIALADRQANWVSNTTRLQPVFDIIERSLGATKLTKCVVKWTEGRLQMSIDMEAVGEFGIIDRQFRAMTSELEKAGFRSTSTEQPKQQTGMRYRGVFIFQPKKS